MISLLKPNQKLLETYCLDLTAPLHGVEVIVDEANHRVWVNVDGICLLRICRIPVLVAEINKCKGEN